MSLINNNLILLNYFAETKDDVLRALTNLAHSASRLHNKELFLEELYRREAEAPTNIGYSIAIPHGKTDSVKEATLMFIRLNKEIQWNDDRVHLIFGIAVPASAPSKVHLTILANIARKLIHEEMRISLDAITTPEELIALLDQ